MLRKVSLTLASILAGAWIVFLASTPTATTATERLYVTHGANAVLKAERDAAAAKAAELESTLLADDHLDRLARADGMGADNLDVVVAQMHLRAELQHARSRTELGREAESAFWRGHFFAYGFLEVAIRGYRACWLSDLVAIIVPRPRTDWPTGTEAWRWADDIVPAEHRADFHAAVAANGAIDVGKWRRLTIYGMPMEAADEIWAAETWSQAAALRHRLRSAEFDAALLRANGPAGPYLWTFPILGVFTILGVGLLLCRLIGNPRRKARPT